MTDIVNLDRPVVSTSFTVNDLPEAFFEDAEEAADFLHDVAGQIRDAMVSAGNDAIDNLLRTHMEDGARERLAREGCDEDEIEEELESGECFNDLRKMANDFHVMDMRGYWLVRNYDMSERQFVTNWSRDRKEACAFLPEEALAMQLAHGCVLVPTSSPHPLERDPALDEEPGNAPG